MPARRSPSWLILTLLVAAGTAHAMVGEPAFVSFEHVPQNATLVADGAAAPLWLDEADHPAVLRAARDVQADIERVTGVRPGLNVRADANNAEVSSVRGSSTDAHRLKTVLIAGTLGHSRLVDALVARGRLDARAIQGKWESYLVEVIAHPVAGVDRAVVIAGSDRRGTIYGLYDLSEQIGVSPWYWWADVPVAKHSSVYVKPGRTVRGEPAVKYRGIFINDEAPAMQGWAVEKFGGFNHELYAHVFELILRLRGNYLWPAMWGNAFVDDDPRNAPLAAEYGIVLGTSHHEPMMRAHDEWRRHGKGAWDYSVNDAELREFWRGGVEHVRDNEKIVTVGMRGDGDEAMSEQTNVALLERIVADQRTILEKVTGRPAAETPQVWALYKEVQDYYERGMRVPDDVTLLWCDDNWGNIRRLPLTSERNRAGGAGVYYHFDYVGGPRNYKWINTVPITKIQEQMNLAWQYGATRLWIVNVGDLKPMEFPIEFFLTMAWNPSKWTARALNDYSVAWATRELGAKHAQEIAALINGYTKLNGRRKPELLAPDTFSLVSYGEADRVLKEWADLVERAERVYADLPEAQRAAFFELVLYPVKASAGIQELYVATGRNRLYARQGRAGANEQAARARALFAADAALVREYHELNGGKWNHMMSQAKLGYTSWQQPDIEVAPPLSEVHPRGGASMAIAVEGSEVPYPSQNSGTAQLPPLDAVSRGTRRIEVFNRGDTPFTYTVTASHPWITVTPSSGSVSDVAQIDVAALWDSVPAGDPAATVHIEASTGEKQDVQVALSKPAALAPRGFAGFIESDRYIAIEAPHFSRAIGDGEITWRTLPDFGPTLGGVTSFPVTAVASEPGRTSARLEYEIYLFSKGQLELEWQLAPSLDFQGGEGLRFAVSFDDAPPQIVRVGTMATLADWNKAVADGVRRVTTTHTLEQPGRHVLKFWRITPGVVLERIIIDAGGVRPSYLGPPESSRGALARAQ